MPQNPYLNRFPNGSLRRLEPYAGKLARTVLRGEGGSDAADLLDCYDCTSSLLTRKTQQYPSHYTSSRMAQYKADIASKKKCCDCIGLIKGYYWAREDGTQKYGLDGRPDKGAEGMFSAAKVKGRIATLPEIPGLLLYSPGHVGVYIGGGYAVEARGFNYGVMKTKVSQRPWTYWYQCPYIDYVDGAPAEPAPLPETPAPTPTPVPAPGSDSARLLRYKKGQKMLRGEDVTTVQTRLVALGYNPGKVDGIYGPVTETAVKAFQTAAAIEVDGIVGPVTRNALAL